MKIRLSRPYYKIQRRFLERDLLAIRKIKFNRFIRRRIPFFMDGYRYAVSAVKKRWGLDVYFFESGHEQVKPVWLDGTLDELAAALWLNKMAEDKKFSRRLVNELAGIIETAKSLVRFIPPRLAQFNTNLFQPSPYQARGRLLVKGGSFSPAAAGEVRSDLSKSSAASRVPQRKLEAREAKSCLLAHLEYWIKYFEVGFLWFAAEHIRQAADNKIRTIWQGGKKELEFFLESVYRPMKLPPSSLEQRDLLKLAPLGEKALKRAIRNHWKKYRHLSLHNIDDDYFDIQYYLNRVEALKRSPAEFKNARKVIKEADYEMRRATALVKKAKLPAGVKDKTNFVRWLMYLRTATIDYMMMVNGAYKPVFQFLAEIFDLPLDAVLHMTVEEIISSLDSGKLAVSRKLILERTKNGYAYLIAPHGSYLVTGKEVDELRSLVIDEKAAAGEFLKGQTAFSGRVRGVARIILDRRNAHELKRGEILVTTMTSPEFVPAMKIAGAIVTNEGGILCHAAIMSRELRKPCIIGTKIATDVLKDGDLVEVDAENGVVKILK